MKLDDDDPFWERHSGKDLHQRPEWQQGDNSEAEQFYASISPNARVIIDYLMDRPGELISADVIAGQLRDRKSAETLTSYRLAVASSFSKVRGPAVRSGRRLPFYWWAGTNGSVTRYAMKPQVAQLFRETRHQSAPYL